MVDVAAVNYRGLEIPFTRMGAVTSDDLFEEREQAIFDFYERNKDRYRRALDIGANIGIHSILMARQGWDVRAFEPDPDHHAALVANLQRNGAERVSAHQEAVSTADGDAYFVRVLGNTTANHLLGARSSYGERKSLLVKTVDCRGLFSWADFAKIDCEGHEAALLLTVTPEQKCEFVVEIGSAENAGAIFLHFKEQGRAMYAQRLGWQQVLEHTQMPSRYQDGSLFIGGRK